MPKVSKTPNPLTPTVTATVANKMLAFKSASWLQHQATDYRPQVTKSLALWKIATRQNPDQLVKWARKQKEPKNVEKKIEEVGTKLHLTESRKSTFTSHIRGHLTNNGGVIMPKNHNQYIPKVFHDGYTKTEIQKLLGKLPDDLHKLYVTIAAETGLRARKILQIKIGQILKELPETPEYNISYPHIQFEPKDYLGRKRVGYIYISSKIMKEIQRLQEKGVISKQSDQPLIPRAYISIYQAILRSKKQNQLNPKISTIHGFRDYYEQALDSVEPRIDGALKARLAGRSLGPKSNASGYTTRDIPTLQNVYTTAYPWIDISNNAPAAISTLQHQYDTLKKEHDTLKEQFNQAGSIGIQIASQATGKSETELREIATAEIQNLPIDTKLRFNANQPTMSDLLLLSDYLQRTLQSTINKSKKQQ